MCTQSDEEKHLHNIIESYKATSTATSNLCRKVVFALIAAVWILFQQHGTFPFAELPTRAIGLLGIYIILDVFQYFASASGYFALHFFRKRLGDNIGKWQHKVDKALYLIFLAKILYLIIVMGICIYFAFKMNVSDIYNPNITA